MQNGLQICLKALGWFFRCIVVFWFLLSLLLPFYGFLKPWKEAETAMQAEGINGVALMIGGGSNRQRSADGGWLKTTGRSYIVIPDSFQHLEIISYEHLETSAQTSAGRVIRSKGLGVYLGLFAAAGLYTAYRVRLRARRRRARAAKDTDYRQ